MDSWDVARMQKVVYVFGMAIGCLCELESMKALNKERENEGQTLAYDEKAFCDLYHKWGMHHNAIMSAVKVE